MSKLDKFKRRNKSNEGVNSAIADLMSGLMIVFLFISVAFMSKVYDENINIKNGVQNFFCTPFFQTKGSLLLHEKQLFS